MTDKENLPEQTQGAEAPDLTESSVDNKLKQVCDGPSVSQLVKAAVTYPILNFFGGTVTTDRQRHENKAQDGGLKYWRNNTSKQREEDNTTAFTDSAGHTDYDLAGPKAAARSTTSEHSTGMGLEGENLHSFLTTGSHQIVPLSTAPAAKGTGAVFKYRSKASSTFTNLPQLKQANK